MASGNIILFLLLLNASICMCKSAKINTPRVLLPWLENLYVNFTFEIIEGGCYTWSLSRDDIIDLEPLYEDSWGHCSRSARVSVSKTCVSPGTVIILAQEVNSGEILRGDVDVDKINSLKVLSTTWKLYLEEAPEAFEVIASDEQGNTFTTLEGVPFEWSVENVGNNFGEDSLVNFVQWSDTDYEAPRGIAELEAKGFRSYSVLLYGKAMGDCQVTVCLGDICTQIQLQIVPSVVLTPATAIIALGDTLRYKVVKVFAGRLTVQNIQDTQYYTKLPKNDVADLEDSISLVRGLQIGTTGIYLMSGVTEVTSAVLTVAQPYSIRVTLRPSGLVIRGEKFIIHSTLLDNEGHALTAGDEVLIRLSVEGNANVDLLRSTENGTLTDAVAHNAGSFTVTARLHSVAGKTISQKVQGQVSAVVEDPLEVVPPELYVAWTETVQKVHLQHRGGGDEPVTWSIGETATEAFSLSTTGDMAVRGAGSVAVHVHLTRHPHVRAKGRVWSSPIELLQVSSSGRARVGRPHQLHIALTAAHPSNGELYNYNVCDCASFAVSLLEGPEPQNVTAAPWIQPVEGACCVVEVVFTSRGVSTLRVSRARVADTARVAVSSAPALLWPTRAAALVGATLPVIAEGEALVAQPSDSRVAELTPRDGQPPYNHPDVHLFTLKCHKKGESTLEVWSGGAWERSALQLEAACAAAAARLRLEPPEPAGNCSGPATIWLRPGHEVSVRVTLFDVIGRELLDERGPRVSWDIEPNHVGIEYKTNDRLFVQIHPDFEPVPVPHKYYQLVVANEKAIGWSGLLKANVDGATANIQAKVVAPLKCEPLKVHMAWEGDNSSAVGTVRGGSGKYSVEAGGAAGAVRGGALYVQAPAPGSYHVRVADACAHDEHVVEVHMEEILSVEVSTSRAVSVGGCVPISTLVRGVSQRYLSTSSTPEWRTHGHVVVKDGLLCGVKEGSGRVRAAVGGVWSSDVEVGVFGALRVEPAHARIAAGAKLQLRAVGGPPAHLAAKHYRPVSPHPALEVTSTGLVHGLTTGTARIKLVAVDGANVEIDSAEAEIEVVPISGIQARAATRTLLVGAPCPLWLEAEGLSAASLAALHPAPRVTWTLRDPAVARLYTSYSDDLLERSVAEGLSVRVVPLKPGAITIDVRVRNMGQVAETRSWDSAIEILAISDITTSVKGISKDLTAGDRLALSVGAVIRLQSTPRSSWKAFGEGVFEVTGGGELKALAPGYGVVVAHHRDERINVYRETVVHVEVAVPLYCTVEPAGTEETALRIVLRNSVGRALLAPNANVSASPAAFVHPQHIHDSALGTELLMTGVDAAGAFMSFHSTAAGVTVTDEVWVPGNDAGAERIVATGGWLICLRGEGWRAGAGTTLVTARGATLALLTSASGVKLTLRRDRPAAVITVHQLPVQQLEFVPGEWPYALVPLTTTATGLTAGPILCTEEQKYALEGVQVELPYTCRTEAPHTAEPAVDIINGQMGCKVVPGDPVTEASEVEVCAEWGLLRSCTRVLLLPPVQAAPARLSVVQGPAAFTVRGHPRALRLLKVTSSPGLKLDTTPRDGEITVTVSNEPSSTCGLGGYGWVNVNSKLTAQELKIDVQRECDVAYGTVLGALYSLIRPYLSTLATIVAAIGAYVYIQSKLQQKVVVRMPTSPMQTVLPPLSPSMSPSLSPSLSSPAPPSPAHSPRPRPWSRSPPAPAAPAYGDASFSPSSQRRVM